jgi:hypothetical protein
MGKSKYCDLRIKNLGAISGCNIVSCVVEFFLLVVVVMVFRYSLGLSGSGLLTDVLIVLVCILGLAFGLTFVLMMGEAFVRTNKYISRIYSFEESEDMGIRESKAKSMRHVVSRSVIKLRTNKRGVVDCGNIRSEHRAFN